MKIYDWHSCEQVGSVTFEKKGWGSCVSGPELSAEIKIYPKLAGFYCGEVCVVIDDDKYLGFLCEDTAHYKQFHIIKYFKHSLLLADDLTPKQAAVVLTALLILIHENETDKGSPGA